MARGIEGRSIFNDDEDRQQFLSLLSDGITKIGMLDKGDDYAQKDKISISTKASLFPEVWAKSNNRDLILNEK
jgi:hypothetical protein